MFMASTMFVITLEMGHALCIIRSTTDSILIARVCSLDFPT